MRRLTQRNRITIKRLLQNVFISTFTTIYYIFMLDIVFPSLVFFLCVFAFNLMAVVMAMKQSKNLPWHIDLIWSSPTLFSFYRTFDKTPREAVASAQELFTQNGVSGQLWLRFITFFVVLPSHTHSFVWLKNICLKHSLLYIYGFKSLAHLCAQQLWGR